MKYFFVFSDDPRTNDVKNWKNTFAAVNSGTLDDFETVEDASLADAIVVVGGDGTLLHAVHEYHHLNIPFLGIDRGTMGFNLNSAESFDELIEILENLEKHTVVELQLIEIKILLKSGGIEKRLAFNDAFIESTSTLNGRIVTEGFYAIDRYFRGNGVIVATPQGSTAYTHSAGGKVIPLDKKMLAITTICSQGQHINKVAEMKKVVVSVDGRDEAVLTADFHKVRGVSGFTVRPSGKTVKLVFTDAIKYELKRFHIEDEIEKRTAKWAPLM